MSITEVSFYMQRAIYVTLIVLAPILISTIVIGLIISIFQAITSIQDQSLSVIPKIVLILILVALLGPWMMGQLVSVTREFFLLIPKV